MSNPKMVIAVRTDLKLRRGKESAQCGHASMAWVFRYDKAEAPILDWIDKTKGNQKKIVVAVDSLEELQELVRKAQALGVDHYVIEDAGHTEVEPGTITCASFGPASPEALDPFLGHLKLR